ncbi:hypothetical protein [Spirosoma aerolatum]|uniref:hypothetical protein n=1 Tax=Spirosoma aerolatum TaxID=1211326 RepID=UPI0009AD5768|nr:hypothetical protein [Spirosoma aerolatum]
MDLAYNCSRFAVPGYDANAVYQAMSKYAILCFGEMGWTWESDYSLKEPLLLSRENHPNLATMAGPNLINWKGPNVV